MKPTLRKLIVAVLAVVFVGSSARVIYQAIQYEQGDKIYSEAAELVNLPDLTDLPDFSLPQQADGSAESSQQQAQEQEPKEVYVDPYADALRNMDFTALREVNSDVLGWILIPGTNVSYPLVQGADNDYYLNRTWKKTRSSVGSIFMECRNSRDLSDFNTIIYGHRMNNRSMFGTLSRYDSQDYWAQHPFVYITDDNGSHRYEIFAAYEVSVEGDTYRLGFSSDQSKQAFIDFCVEQSVIETGLVPTVYDRVLTLSTCTGNGHATRWVVQAVLRGEAPSDSVTDSTPDSAGDTSTGDTSTGDTSTGDASTGDASTGDASTGDASTGDTSTGDASTGDASAEDTPNISQDVRPEDILPAA